MPRDVVKKPMVNMPHSYIVLEVGGQRSSSHHCGTQFAKAVARGRDLPADEVERLAFGDYDISPGSTVTITISFHGEGKMHRPKGDLRLTTDRGKLSTTRVKLDGKQEKVTVELATPDETIKTSVRAFLDGYARGKAHLHLQ
jgi:hypothetical protein